MSLVESFDRRITSMPVQLSFMKSSHRSCGPFVVIVGGVLLVSLSVWACAADPPKAESAGKGKAPPQTAVKEATPATTVTTSDQDALPKPPIDEAHPLYLPLQEAYKSREALKAVKDYEAVFVKRELIGRRHNGSRS